MSRKFRYLFVGAWNTLFGYSLGVILYFLLEKSFHIVLICVISNIVCITMSFFMYKVFVFQTKGNWLAEYLRSYFVYGGSALFGTVAIWILVDTFKIPFWISQGITISLTVVISYFGHICITFPGRESLPVSSNDPSSGTVR